MSSTKILVVDDEPFNLDIVGEYLEEEGYSLDMASSGEEAWEMLVDPLSSFDLVILDRMMPGIDGMEVLRRIKADARLNELPVIMQTAAASPDQVREGLAAGAYYYLTKPFEPESLQSIVRAALDDLKQRRSLSQRIELHVGALKTLNQGEFRFHTLDEAHALAALAASLCDEPEIVVLGLSELLINAVEHGNLGIEFEQKSRLREAGQWEEEIQRRLQQQEFKDRRAKLNISVSDDSWVFLIEDEGDGFDWHNFLELAPERAFAPNGRGIALARQLAFSSLEYQGKGNVVRAVVMRRPA